jgi:hypothetical protein
MSSVWCDKHRNMHSKYNSGPVLPMGYPNPAVLCHSSNCATPGKVWLSPDEYHAYQQGFHIFTCGFCIHLDLQGAPGVEPQEGTYPDRPTKNKTR